ncbi:hypothetical protein [Levilactobacillus acidifarinae]|uniref:Uncharacterized protein n=1 Tax=Levilactobacillus acidifarinae DSM 19394 = JCM 15949 TaxID=1423715 RepID=A0A0R1LWI7_9LACO|nr:hypothetical protein [Levilactobacillus acidifarinae]KRK96055.1 hypothetical protein FD25_GL002516 [Levilactobacillus acidifarinae DSM 19394]GEO69671.1 hypothetical protein LAC03_15810 [Levilactobacillus acidifarinae]
MKRIIEYALILVTLLGILVFAMQRTSTTQSSSQPVTAQNNPNISNYSPDKTYHRGDLVVSSGTVYRVLTKIGPANTQKNLDRLDPHYFQKIRD